MPLDAENEMELSLRHELVRHNYSLGGGGGSPCFGSRPVNVQFDINFATSVSAGRM
jgi:hypothetical protein